MLRFMRRISAAALSKASSETALAKAYSAVRR
jgi:hypothetical protein